MGGSIEALRHTRVFPKLRSRSVETRHEVRCHRLAKLDTPARKGLWRAVVLKSQQDAPHGIDAAGRSRSNCISDT